VSCAPPPTFRLLDGWTGWDPDPALGPLAWLGLEGLGEGEAIELALVGGGVDPNALLPYLPPPRLARGCGPCEWFMISGPPVARVLRRDACLGFVPADGAPGVAATFVDPVAITARRHRIAVADVGAGAVLAWARGGLSNAIAIPFPGARLVAFTSWGEILAIADGATTIARFGLTGVPHGTLAAPLPALPPGGAPDRLAVGNDCAVWLVTREPAVAIDGTPTTSYHLWRAERDAPAFAPATLAALQQAFTRTGLARVSDLGFCIDDAGPDGTTIETCYAWSDGHVLAPTEVMSPGPPLREKRGQLMTVAIDSGIPRCRWHRVRLDLDLPFGTACELAVASNEQATPPPQGVATPPWIVPFPPGLPHPEDWAGSSARDFLVDQPPGRYLFVRLRLTGDGYATPSVRRVRLDMPRTTSLDFLPDVYRADPEATAFAERFLSLFDATVEDLDRAIARAPALLDADGVPDAALPWLARFLDIALDPAWSPAQRRAIIDAAPALYRARGTVSGLADTIALVIGTPPAIQELSQERLWGALDRTAVVNGVRLFGASRARFALDRSALGTAPVSSFGNPAQDPFAQLAFRFRVLAPPTPFLADDPTRLRRLVEAIKPAHTRATVRVGGAGFIVGIWANVGIDSVLGSVPAPVLGTNVRLSRMTVLWPGRGGRGGAGVGSSLRVGEARAT